MTLVLDYCRRRRILRRRVLLHHLYIFMLLLRIVLLLRLLLLLIIIIPLIVGFSARPAPLSKNSRCSLFVKLHADTFP